MTNAAALLIAEASRGLFIGSMFGYLQSISSDNPTATLGWAVAMFSAGRLAASFALGSWAHAGASYATILQATFFIQILGNMMYIAAIFVPPQSSAILFVIARLVVGFGSGTLGTCRAVVADITPSRERTAQLAWLSLAKFVGYALMPGAGIFWTMNWTLMGIPINQFTAPGCFSVFLCVLGVILVRNSFDSSFASAAQQIPTLEPELKNSTPPLDPAHASVSAGNNSECAPDSRLESVLAVALALFLTLNMVTKGVTAVAEAALAALFAETHGQADGDDLQQDTAKFTLILGVAGLACYALMVAKPSPSRPPPRPAPRARRPDPPSGKPETDLEAAQPPPVGKPRGEAGGLPGGDRAEEPLLLCGPADALADDDSVDQDALRAGANPSLSTDRTASPPAPASGAALAADAAADGGGGGGGWLLAAAAACLRRGRAWYAARAERFDERLLSAGLLATAAGATVMAAAPAESAAALMAGMLLLWSFGGPVADVLCVSCYSVLMTRLGRPGQARAMGYIAAAGSVGRIALPAAMAVLSARGTLALSAAVSTAAAVAALAFYAAYLPSRCPCQAVAPTSAAAAPSAAAAAACSLGPVECPSASVSPKMTLCLPGSAPASLSAG